MPAVPCTSNPISFLPKGLTLPNGNHASNNLMAGNNRTIEEQKISLNFMYFRVLSRDNSQSSSHEVRLRKVVRMAHATGFDFD